MATPNAMVVVGDTDWLSTSRRDVGMSIDSTLRKCRQVAATVNTWGTALCAGSRTASARPIYAECVNVSGSANCMFGLIDESLITGSTYTTWIAQAANACAMRQTNAANIYLDAAINQSGLGGATAGDVMGLKLWDDSGTPKCQFYKNGSTYGAAVSLSSADFVLGVSWAALGADLALRVDRDDLQYLPDDCDPWGAAARVADIGGYSPAGSKWSATETADSTIDAYGKTTSYVASLTANAMTIAATANAPKATGKVYAEVGIELFTATVYFGLVERALAAAATPWSYIGTRATDWAVSTGGNKRNNNVTTGVGWGAAPVVGSRIGIIWDRDTGGIWFTHNGTPLQGDPEAGTGASYTNVTGTLDLVPAVEMEQNERVRLCTHAREQLYRPSYAEAWDGADVLPEQYFEGTLTGNPEFERRLHFPIPWGGSPPRGSVGSIDIANSDGSMSPSYDDLVNFDLRDQDCNVYRKRSDGSVKKLARLVCDGIQTQGLTVLRVMLRDRSALLNRHTETVSDTFLLGAVFLTGNPLKIISGTDLTYHVSNSQYTVNTTVLDEGVVVTDWLRMPVDSTAQAGIQRTVSPSGKQGARPSHLRRTDDVSITNGDFASWTGDNPNSWTVVESVGSPNSQITQASGKCRFIRDTGASECSIRQSISSLRETMVQFTVSGFVSGDLSVIAHRNSDGTALSTFPAKISGDGTYNILLRNFMSGVDSDAYSLKFSADEGTDLAIDSVSVFGYKSTAGITTALTYVMEDLAGFSSSDWAHARIDADFYISEEDGNVGDVLCKLNYYSDDNVPYRKVLDDVLHPLLISDYWDSNGVMQFVWLGHVVDDLLDSSSPSTPVVAELTESTIASELSVSDDLAPALSLTTTTNWNYNVHSESELAGSVTASLREYMSRQYTTRTEEELSGFTGDVHDAYAFARNAAPILRQAPTFVRDASIGWGLDGTLSVFYQAYENRRRFADGEWPWEELEDAEPGDIVSLTHSRFGLSAGVRAAVVSLRVPLLGPNVRVKLWY